MERNSSPRYETLEEYEKWLFESSLTEIFINRIKYVYNLKSPREAMSVVWSNDLLPVVKYMARFYYEKNIKQKENYQKFRETRPKKSIPKEILHEAEVTQGKLWRDKWKEKEPEKYSKFLKSQTERTKKLYYSKKGLDDSISNFKKRIYYMDYELIELFKRDFQKIKQFSKDKKTERILVIKKI